MTNIKTKNYKRWLIISAITLAALVGAAFLLYKPVVVYTVSHAIADSSSTAPVYLGSYGKKIQKIKKPINKASEQVIYKLDSLHIPFEVFLQTIDNVDKKEILKTLAEIEKQKPTTSGQIFDITKKNITVTAFDVEAFRKPFVKYATMPRIQKALHYINENRLAEELDITVSREIIKNILIQKRAEIDYRLKKAGGITTH
jgi:hypothetical protein